MNLGNVPLVKKNNRKISFWGEKNYKWMLLFHTDICQGSQMTETWMDCYLMGEGEKKSSRQNENGEKIPRSEEYDEKYLICRFCRWWQDKNVSIWSRPTFDYHSKWVTCCSETLPRWQSISNRLVFLGKVYEMKNFSPLPQVYSVMTAMPHCLHRGSAISLGELNFSFWHLKFTL